MSATEADRAAAHALWNEVLCNGGVPGWTATGAIAAALAAEREKARAPFLALADELIDESNRQAGKAGDTDDPLRAARFGAMSASHLVISQRIRRAAEAAQ